MDGETAVKIAGWLGESIGFWIQTGAYCISAAAAVGVIYHNGRLSKKRALIDLIIQQKANKDLMDATQKVYRLHEDGNHLSSLVGSDSDSRRAILQVLNNQEFISAGIRMGAFDESVYKQMQCSNVLKLWDAASGFVHELRKIDGKSTIFQDLERLAKRWKENPIKQV